VVLGDIIIGVDNQQIRSNDDYYAALEKHKPGDKVTIKARRGDRVKTYQVELIESQ
jgi:S1-C subfamily serine protease